MSVRLTPGIRVRMNDEEYVLAGVNHVLGCITLRSDSGFQTTISTEDFVNHPRLAEVRDAPVPQDAALERLDARALEILHKRLAHVYEAETGYKSGTADNPLPNEPRPQYDPATTTLTQRRRAKATELDNEHAIDAGTSMSYTTIRRIGKGLANGHGLNATVDRRLVRRSPGRTSINDQVEAACEEVFERTRLASNMTHRGRYILVRQYMRDVFGSDEDVPHEKTVTRWFKDRFIPSELNGKARSRRSATNAPSGGFSRPNPTRPGELVCLDTCSLDVLLEGTTFAGVIRGVVIFAIDWYSRSIVAVRVLEGSEQAIDITFILREIARPKAMLPGWALETRWPFVGVPESVLSDVYGGHNYAGMPFVSPEAVVTDHGNTYKAHINVATASQQGVSILPARVRSGSDKQVVERTFGSLKTMLLQYLSGYRGSDPSERGQDTDDQVKYSVQDLEDFACWWAVVIWQNHVMSDARPDWCPEGDFSPNMLYEYGLAQTGLPLRAMSSDDYYTSLPAVHVKIHSRGVHVRGLWYDDDTGVLDDLRNEPSPYGGIGKGKWTVRYDPRDLRQVFLLDQNGDYQTLTWTGATRYTPCFNDRHAAALAALRRSRGISAHSQEQLNEILLTEILAVHEPVENWPTLSKAARKEISRRKRQETMAERDRSNHGVPTFRETFAARSDPTTRTDPAVPLQPQAPTPVEELDRSHGPRQPEAEADLPEARPAPGPVPAAGEPALSARAVDLSNQPPRMEHSITPAQRLNDAEASMFGLDLAAVQAARAAAVSAASSPAAEAQEQP